MEVVSPNTLRSFFEPKSIAIIGASRERGTVGGELFHNVITGGFSGKVYAVNLDADYVQGHKSYRSVDSISADVELAIIAVPARHVLSVAESCVRKNVKAMVVISAGFSEAGEEGKERQQKLVELCRYNHIRLIGPNCMGIANTDPAISLHATFGPQAPPPGKVGFLTQSGALGLAIIDYARKLDLGFSTFVSYGNKADVSVNDLLEYWEDDLRTEVILLYLESFGNPQRFSKIARRVSQKKPIVALKSGRSPVGVRAAGSHTGTLLSGSDITIDALFREAGVIRTDTLEELFDIATLLAHTPVPQGSRVAIVTNAGGPGIMCADACEASGLAVSELSESTQRRLRAFLPKEASTQNPVDLLAAADATRFKQALEIISEDEDIDAVITIFIPPIAHAKTGEKIYEYLAQKADRKTTVMVLMSADNDSFPDVNLLGRVPVYTFPESAARALSKAVSYGKWCKRKDSYVRPSGTDQALARSITKNASTSWLSPIETTSILSAYGISVADCRIVATPAEAEYRAKEFGCNMALKAWGKEIIHKSDFGGVELNLDYKNIGEAFKRIEDRLGAKNKKAEGFIIQPMVMTGVEMFVGITQEANFGSVLVCGAGGTVLELIKDIQISLVPVSYDTARQMLAQLKIYPLLTGYRGRSACNIEALVDAVVRIGTLACDFPQIIELDCNPIMITSNKATVVDCRMRLKWGSENE